MKILVVDDEPTHLKLVQVVLSFEGNEVTEAEAVHSALAEIGRSQPEAILLDLQLPGADGLMLARSIRRDPKTQHITLIAVTAFPEQFPREAAMAAGCDGYLVKPINTRQLQQQVSEVIARAKQVR